MARPETRTWKRAIAAATCTEAGSGTLEAARASALLLLGRSVAMGHGRLAVQRLLAAVRIGADVQSAHWVYCREQAKRSHDPRVRTAYLEAALLVASSTDAVTTT